MSGPAVVSSGPVLHAASLNTGTPVVATPAIHHSSHNAVHNDVHNEVVHHGEHGGSEGGYGYDEKPDPFHFEYGV